MRIEHYLTFHKNSKKVILLLEKNNIPFNAKSFIYSFNLFEDDPVFELFIKYIKNGEIIDSPATARYHYSKEDIDNSEWFQIRSTHHWSYPQPEDNYLNVTYNTENYCQKCGHGLIQNSFFRMKSEPSWGRRKFMHLHWVMDELFINTRLLGDFIKQGFSGFNIKDVYSKNGKEILSTVKQVYINNFFKCNYTYTDSTKYIKCTNCNTEKHVLGFIGLLTADNKSFKKIKTDIFKSEEIFGDGLMASHHIIVSKKVLNYFLDKSITEIVFTPIIFG